MRYKTWFFIVSFLLIVPGLISLALVGLKPSIDFVGGSLFEVRDIPKENFERLLSENTVTVVSVTTTSSATVIAKTKVIEEPKHQELKKKLEDGGGREVRFETVGPSVSKDLVNKAFLSVLYAIVGILLYIAYAFRKVPRSTSSWRFGVATLIALLHDVAVLVGAFSLLGHFFGFEVDTLFVTAALTVMGFSVHDTIVVFDRIRENLKRYPGVSFEEVANVSIFETLGRSINTSATAILVLIALLLFGGPTIKHFVLALLIGIISGTFSSIFTATPVLVYWQNVKTRRS